MSDSLLAELRRSADPDDRRVADLLMPLAASSGQLRMPAADEALTTFLVEAMGAAADQTATFEPGEPALVVQLGPSMTDRSPTRRVGPAVLAAAAVVAVVTALGAAALTGVGQRDEGPVVVTPAVQTPTPMTQDGGTDDPVVHPQASPAPGDGAVAGHHQHHGSTGGSAAVVVGPGAASGSGTGTGGADHHGSTTAPSPTPTTQATGDDGGDPGDDGSGDGSSDGSGDDGTAVGTSGGGDDATTTPTPSPTGEAGDGVDLSSSDG